MAKIDETKTKEDQNEAKMLEDSIDQICSLLSVGFGDAGQAIIASNLKKLGEFDPLLPGNKVRAIFGVLTI